MTIHSLLRRGLLLGCACLAAQAQPTITRVISAGSQVPSFSPGSFAFISGTNLIVSGSNTTVTVGSMAAAVLSGDLIDDTNGVQIGVQLNVQLPVNAPVGPTTLTVTVGQASASTSITLAAYAPAFLVGGFYFLADATTGASIDFFNPATPGETLTVEAVGLGATNPAVATGGIPSGPTPTVANVSMTLGTETFATQFAGLVAAATYKITFTVPKDAKACANQLTINVGNISSPSFTMSIASTVPAICLAQNSATYATIDSTHAGAANSFVSVYAVGLTAPESAGSLFPATSYQGIEVDFNDVPMPLYNVLPQLNLINTMIPANAGTSGGTLTVKSPAGSSARYAIALAPADVGIFRMPDPANPKAVQAAALLTGTYWFAMPASLARVYNLPTNCTSLPKGTPCAQPARPGDQIVIYFAGAGVATANGNPSAQLLPTGQVAPSDGSVLYKTLETPVVTIGGQTATVGFCGIAPGTATEYQVNVTIPSGVGPGNAVPVTITMSGSSDTATIASQTP